MKGIDKVQLISPPNDYLVPESGSMGLYPNLALVSLATTLKKSYPGMEIEVMDGCVTGTGEMLKRLDSDLVGISALTPSYGNALEIAERAKERGSLVVLGNDHASYLGKEILENREFVDFIIYGDDGERSLIELVRNLHAGGGLGETPNLMFRGKGGEILKTGKARYAPESIPIPDRSFSEKWETFIERYNKKYGKWHEGKVINALTNFTKGCRKGEKNKCLYCGIQDLGMRHVSPERAWNEVREMKEKYGVNFIYEVGDSFTSFAYPEGRSFVDELVRKKPDDLNPEWFVYGNAEHFVNGNVTDLLKRLGVVRVNVGLDSGDDMMLRAMQKAATSDANRIAAEKLAKSGIQIYTSYVLGAPGETRESLERTLSFNHELLELGDVITIDPSVLVPLPGSKSWDMFMMTESGKEYGGRDMLDTESLTRDWVREFCPRIDYETIQDFVKEIRKTCVNYGVVPGAFGVKGF